MEQVLYLGDLTVDVIRKDIKNLHLSVHPPTGRIRIAAPQALEIDAIRAYAISRMVWIRTSQRKLLIQPRETTREYLDRESHFVWGERVLLQVHHGGGAPHVHLEHRSLLLNARADLSRDQRHQIVEGWYRDILRSAAEPVLARWEAQLSVKAAGLLLQRMKTKWGSCNTVSKNVRLNTELAKKPPECLNYVILHELTHLLEGTHSDRFFSILDRNLPQWREVRRLLNSLPLSSATIKS
jgi:predicted metal-dependent hydrolase